MNLGSLTIRNNEIRNKAPVLNFTLLESKHLLDFINDVH
jgi:hypothetical protein